MDILDYLKALRRRWRIVVIVVMVASFAAFATAPAPSTADRLPSGTTFTATTTLLRAPDAQQLDPALTRLYVTTGEIPQRVAKKLGFDGVPAQLAARITVAGDDQVGSVTITTEAETAAEAERIVNTFADETIAYLVESRTASRRESLSTINRAITLTTDRVVGLGERIAAAAPGGTERAVLEAQRDAVLDQLRALYGQQQQLATESNAAAPLNVLARGQAYPKVVGAVALQAPSGRGPRLLLGLLAGLALGVAAALLIERLDTRIQGRDSAENAFALPVVAEIPTLPRALRASGQIALIAAPESAAAEAFRSLRAALLLMPSRILLGNDEGRRRREIGGQVVLVTAPTARTGKTTTSVNLAVALAESGRRVLLVDADLRNPAIHRALDVENRVGITDLAAMGDLAQLDRVVQRSRVPHVSVLPAGSRLVPGSTIEAALPTILGQARQLADVVVVDAAPLLAGSDALDVLPHVDTVIVVGRVRRTTREQAQRARELLARISVPVLGVALVGSRSGPSAPSGSATMRERFGGLRTSAHQRRSSAAEPASQSRVVDRGGNA